MPRKTPLSRIHVRKPSSALFLLCATTAATLLVSACGGDDPQASSPPPVALRCDDSIKTGFKPDADTSVLLVKAFAKGDALLLAGTATAQTPVAANDLCLVKLLVGPGHPGPVDAPSTSKGIGIEVWLPTAANWNKRFHAIGNGGWGGGSEASSTTLQSIPWRNSAAVAGIEGAVSATTDSGHTGGATGGAFAMNPDGTINTALWRDFSSRAIHEMAVKTKALATAYYGTAPTRSYFEGFSGGGREAMKAAQAHPADFDGILAGAPTVSWTSFITADLYPQIVFQRDLAGPVPSLEQQDLVSNAAIGACDLVGGQHLGFILDPSQCRYDPTRDASVLCSGVVGHGGVVGTNTTAACVNLAQANAINKVWFGMTADGSVSDPAADNGWSTSLQGTQRWYGLARGTSLYARNIVAIGSVGLTHPSGPFTIATDMVALALQDPRFAEPNFRNATGNGASAWKDMSYAQLSNAFDRGIALQTAFGGINTDNPDLSAFKARGGKLMHYHGLADEDVPPGGSVHYYNQVLSAMGGATSVESFYRLFMLPGMSHMVQAVGGNGTSNPDANPPYPTTPQLYEALTRWVEQDIAPDGLVAHSATSTPVSKSLPVCAYPRVPTFQSGSPFVAGSYVCR